MSANKYGDLGNVKEDAKTLFEVLNRQGLSFGIDVLTEFVGTHAVKFKLADEERNLLLKNVSNQFKESLSEKL